MTRRSDERAGEEAWRAGADPTAPKPQRRWGGVVIVIVVAVACAAAYAGWRLFGGG
jgi:hypothetical protein